MLNNLTIAHRGCHDDKIPENSLRAFQKCLNKNLAIELDVHILKDNKIVVFHDDNLIRMTGVNEEIKNLTYEEVKKLRLKNTSERIPLLTEVLNLVDGKVLLDIELKFDHDGYLLEDEIIKILKNYDGYFVLKSFSYKTVRYLKKHTDYKIGLLYPSLDNPKYQLNKIQKWLIRHINFNILLKPDFIGCSKLAINDRCIKKFKGPILIWTLKNEKEINKFQNKGYGLISEFNIKK